MDPLVILTGPTAVGKTGLSLRLAEEIGAEIISADSAQVYRGMRIGSAALPEEERRGIPHHLIGFRDPREPYDVTLFQQMAAEAVRGIVGRGRIPLVVGGTGFYIQALLYGIDFTENGRDPEFRETMMQKAGEPGGKEALHNELEQADPASAAAIPPGNVRKVIRALEYYRATGERISEHNAREREKAPCYRHALFVLTMDREQLYRRIDERVGKMLEDGLQEEVLALRELGCTRDMTSMQALGYKEMLDYLDGKITLDEAADRIRQSTRHYAKRQLTWFRREKDVIWLERKEGMPDEALLEECMKHLKMRGIIG